MNPLRRLLSEHIAVRLALCLAVGIGLAMLLPASCSCLWPLAVAGVAVIAVTAFVVESRADVRSYLQPSADDSLLLHRVAYAWRRWGFRCAMGIAFMLVGTAVMWFDMDSRSLSATVLQTLRQGPCHCRGVVVSPPRTNAGKHGYGKSFTSAEVFLTRVGDADGDRLLPQLCGQRIHITVRQPDTSAPCLSLGSEVCWLGILSDIAVSADTADYFTRWLASQGIRLRSDVFAGHLQVVAPPDVSALPPLLRCRLAFIQFRERLVTRNRALADTTAALVNAICLGDRRGLSREVRQTFSATGASHVLALSGLHLSLLWMVFWWMAAPLHRHRHGRTLACFVGLSLVWAYALMTGLSYSILRASIMLSLLAVLLSRRRPGLPLNNLGTAVLLILLFSPRALADTGFQMSVMSVGFILGLQPLCSRWQPRGWMAGRLAGFVYVSVSAQLATMPLAAYHFGIAPLGFLVTNMLAIPCTFVILLLGLTVPLWMLVGWLSLPFNWLLDMVATLMLDGLQLLAGQDWMTAAWSPSLPVVLICYAALVLGCHAMPMLRRLWRAVR